MALKCTFVGKGKNRILHHVGSGDIITLFDKTPTPKKVTDVICPHFYELKWATGCPYNCDWCFLKGTFRFRVWKVKNRHVKPVFKDRKRIEKAVASFINCATKPAVLNTGELGDSLMGENQDPPFSVYILKLFEGTPHKILFLTKGTYVKHFLENEFQKQAILSWSINAEEVAKRFEIGAPNPLQRIAAARKCYEAGYTVRFRLDPMVPILGWKSEYQKIIAAMFDGIKPERITLGSLRGLPATLAVAVRKEWVKYLTEKSNWGRKPPIEIRFEMYKFAIKLFRKHGLRKYGLCKDTVKIHKMLKQAIGLPEMNCNCL